MSNQEYAFLITILGNLNEMEAALPSQDFERLKDLIHDSIRSIEVYLKPNQ